MKKLKRLSERCLALFTALVMCMSLVQATAFAGDLGTASDGSPEYVCRTEEHTHSDACYKLVCGLDETEATEGSDCTHEHDDLCGYAEEQAEVPCACSDEDGDGEINHTDGCGYQPAVAGSSCTHEHDGGCGYAEAVEGHTHTEACKELTCTQAEHTHTDACLAQKDEPECICETKCGEGSIKEDCPVCGTENADLTACEGEEVPAEVPAQVQAFLDAVAALPAPEDIPEEATEAEYEELRVLVEACQDAYDALTYEDMEREDVMAAIETMGAVIEAFCGIQTLEETGGWSVVFDVEAGTLTINGEGTLTWDDLSVLDGSTNAVTLVVTGTGNGVELSGNVFKNFKALTNVILTNVTIPDNNYPFYDAGSSDGMAITMNGGTLGKYAFWKCSALTAVVLENVTIAENANVLYDTGAEGMTLTIKKSTIGKYSFSSSANLVSATVEDCDIGERAFLSCAKLTNITLKNVGSIGKYAFQRCGFTSLELNGVGSIGDYAFSFNNSLTSIKASNISSFGNGITYGCEALTSAEISDCPEIGYRAFRSCPALTAVTITNVPKVGWLAFDSCPVLANVTLSNVRQIEGGAFENCSSLQTINIEAGTKLGYLDADRNLIEVIPGIADRVEAILKGQFTLYPAETIVELTPDAGWDDSKVGRSDNWDQYDNGTQIVEQARWTNDSKTDAEVKVDAYYTAEKQMDFIFVVDLSNSMTLLGNESDMNARFYDMQSKLLDVTGQLLNTPGYDCRVAFVTFGTTSTETVPFCSDVMTAQDAINRLTPYYENTNYGLGLAGAKSLVKTQEVGRETTVIFISDGQPRGEAEDLDGAINAAAIKELGTSIYGVLQSVPDDEHDGAVAAMENVCSDGLFFESSNTESFSNAVNDAIAAAYPDYTVSIPVNPLFEKVNSLNCDTTAGSAKYDADTHSITWTITGMPFTKHTLTYRMELIESERGKVGEHTYPANDPANNEGVAAIRSNDPAITSGNTVETPVLTRTVNQPDPNRYTVTVNYYLAGTTTPVPGTSPHTERLTEGASYNVTAYDRISVPGYTYSSTEGDLTGIMDGNKVINVYYTRTTPTPGPDPDPDPTPVTPRPTPIPDNPTPLNPGPDGTTIPDQDVPLAAPGLNSVDHYAYIIGYPDGLVHPEANVTRAEVATIFFRLMTDEFRTEHWATENAFLDVAAQEWFNNSVSTSSRAGIVKGYEDGSFRPNNNITRAEFAAIAARFLSDEVNISSSFSDISGHWAEEEINRAVMAGWIKGYTDGTFRPNQPITRAEAVTMINRMLDRTPDKDHMLENMIRWDDNTEDKWYYADMQEATNSHDYERLEMVLIEDWTELLENRDWAALQEEWATAASAPGGEVADNLDLSKTGENDLAQGAETAGTENA